MSEVLSRGGVALLKREKASLVAATGLVFERLKETSPDISLQDSLVSYKGGTWGDESIEGVGYPVLRSSNMRGKRVSVAEAAWCKIPDKQAEAFSLESGDILVTKSSGSFDLVGKAALFDDPNDGNLYLFSNFTMRLRPDRKKIIPEYLAWFLRSPQALSWRFENQQTTVGLRNLQTKEYLSQVVPIPSLEIQKQVIDYLNSIETESEKSKTVKLPESLDKQRRTVESVEAIAARIAEAQSLRKDAIKETDILLASAFNHVFDEGNGNLGRKQYLREVATIARGKFSHRPRNEPRFYGGVYPFIQIGDISNSDRFIHNYSQTLNEDGLKISRMFPKGTIVIAITGATIGVTGILEIDACFPDSIVGIISNHDSVLSEYIYWALEHTKHEAVNQATQTTQPNINLRILNELKIYVPPLDEQRRIVAYLDSVQARLASLRELQSATGEELDALLPSVLDRAFKGEL